jgi:hypothetical protein
VLLALVLWAPPLQQYRTLEAGHAPHSLQCVPHQPHAAHQSLLAPGLALVLLLMLVLTLVQLPLMFQLLLLLSRVHCHPCPLLQPFPLLLAVPAHHSLQHVVHHPQAARQLLLALTLGLALVLLLALVWLLG